VGVSSPLAEAVWEQARQQGLGAAVEVVRRVTGVDPSINEATVYELLRGRHAKRPGHKLLSAISAAFPALTIQQLREYAGMPPGEAEEYRPPAEANLLSKRQRQALDELIRAMAEGGGNDEQPAGGWQLAAARRGAVGGGRAAAADQDRAAEAPDAEGPAEGA
jgi:hypothetical protein